MGQAKGRSMEDLIKALFAAAERCRRMPLITLPTINVREACERYAATIGKRAENLTEIERKAAYLRAVLEATGEASE
jgi:hypothetical protein